MIIRKKDFDKYVSNVLMACYQVYIHEANENFKICMRYEDFVKRSTKKLKSLFSGEVIDGHSN